MIEIKRKNIENRGIDMTGEIVIEDPGKGAYKYLGVLEADKIWMNEMKLKVRNDYCRRVRKSLESSLNEGNNVRVLNTYAVAAVRYAARILD